MSLFHFHKWQLHNASPFESTVYGYWAAGVFVPFDKPATSQKTKVLYKCACEKFKTETIDGVWTLDELRVRGE